jgi:hypothetical protein
MFGLWGHRLMCIDGVPCKSIIFNP